MELDLVPLSRLQVNCIATSYIINISKLAGQTLDSKRHHMALFCLQSAAVFSTPRTSLVHITIALTTNVNLLCM
jgi:hypothetical protein